MVVVFGSNGYVGAAVVQELNKQQIPYVVYQARYPLAEDVLQRFLINNKVTTAINCAGFVGLPNVDSCENSNNKVPCLQANALLPVQIKKVCDKLNIGFNHISSGCIYTDAACDRALEPTIAFSEEHNPNFDFDSGKASWYSGTKALGEQLLHGTYCNIFRLRIPFNAIPNNRNYITKLINYPILLNATNSLSNLDEFAAAVVHVSCTGTTYSRATYNVTQPGHIKTAEVVEMLKRKGLVRDKKWFADIDDFNRTVKAPRSNCVLDSTEIMRQYKDIKLTPVHDSLMQAIEEYTHLT